MFSLIIPHRAKWEQHFKGSFREFQKQKISLVPFIHPHRLTLFPPLTWQHLYAFWHLVTATHWSSKQTSEWRRKRVQVTLKVLNMVVGWSEYITLLIGWDFFHWNAENTNNWLRPSHADWHLWKLSSGPSTAKVYLIDWYLYLKSHLRTTRWGLPAKPCREPGASNLLFSNKKYLWVWR